MTDMLRCKVCGEQYPPGGVHCESPASERFGSAHWRAAAVVIVILAVACVWVWSLTH